MAILTGQWTIKIDGASFDTKQDSVTADDLGFRKKEVVADSNFNLHVKLTPPQASLKCTILHMAGTDESMLDKIGANVELISDTGETRRYRNCAITPMGISNEELTVEIVGQRIP